MPGVEILGITGNVNKQGIVSIKIPMECGTLLEALTCKATTDFGDLVLVDRQITQDPDGRYQVVLTGEGAASEFTYSENQDSYELDGSTSEDPIESHPRFNALADKYKAIYDDADRFVGWPRTLPKGNGSPAGTDGKNPLYGLSAYLVGGAVWRRTYASKTLPPELLKNLGCIEVPPGGYGAQVPALDAGRNWLKIRVTAVLRGNIWQITQEWLASGPGGWNADTYRRAGS